MTVLASSSHPRGAAAARRLAARARAWLAALGRPDDELSVLVAGDRAIRALNRRWRGIDRATDVLSFPLSDPPGSGPILGDVVVSLDTAARRARAEGRPVGSELDRYLAHGLLHLLGYDHERPEDARVMAMKEAELARREGLVDAALRRGPDRDAAWTRSRTSTSTRSRSGSTGRGTRARTSRGASRR
ncbi:MAG TPA: rRNA maturation RNase YbeY [Anaeromyxobacteraceae bacterium]|nr:rRNA maturation RNase YbeY [Anaeromyxobacteraceae bacterium]